MAFMRNLLGPGQDEYGVTVSYYQPVEEPGTGTGTQRKHTHARFYHDDEGLMQTRVTERRAREAEAELEVGAESWCKWFLPFKEDRVLRSGRFQRRRKIVGTEQETERVVALEEFIPELKTTVPWLARNPYCVVRVEAFDEKPAMLDRWVYEQARKARFQDIWTEDEASRALGELYVRHGIDYQANPGFTNF
jgi:hypothetical protein